MKLLTVLAVATAGFINAAIADPIVFPKNGQSNETMEKDKYACYGWAKEQTGFDPMKASTASAPPPSSQQGSVGGTAARGALAGAATGAIIGDTSKAARRGMAAGGLTGAIVQDSKNQKSSQQAQQQQASSDANIRSQYDRAFAACLEGKGYTVK